jgi:hypothetical protein
MRNVINSRQAVIAVALLAALLAGGALCLIAQPGLSPGTARPVSLFWHNDLRAREDLSLLDGVTTGAGGARLSHIHELYSVPVTSSVYALALAPSGDLYALGGQGLLIYHPGRESAETVALNFPDGFPRLQAIRNLAAGQDGLIYGGAAPYRYDDPERLFVYDPGTRTVRDLGSPADEFYEMVAARDGGLYLIAVGGGDNNYLIRYDLSSGSVTPVALPIPPQAYWTIISY